jgi:hypothetical protein
VLIAIDDAQWLDQPTAEIVGFVVRRLDAEAIAVLLACRQGEMSPAFAGLATVNLSGLDSATPKLNRADRHFLGDRPSP